MSYNKLEMHINWNDRLPNRTTEYMIEVKLLIPNGNRIEDEIPTWKINRHVYALSINI